MKSSRIQSLTITAFMASVLCIAGPVVIPIGMVPLSFANLAIYLTVILLDKKKATISVALYLLIGFVGVPVFAGFSAGAGKLLGPTGGYLMGYLALSWISGTILELFGKVNKIKIVLKQTIALVSGTIGVYFLGSMWLVYQSKISFKEALFVGVLPFVVFDFIKIMVAIGIGNSMKKRIQLVD